MVLEELGVPENLFGKFAGSTFVMWMGIILVCFVILVFVVGITFYLSMRKNKKVSYKNQIPIFILLNGKFTRVGVDSAKELFIPDSNISLFYLKNHGIYLARPTRAMGKNEFWYAISENGEWVNFDLSQDPEKNTLATTDYDHRDTRYAYVNLKEIIKRNYKDKSILWWKDPVVMNIITFIIMSLIFIGFCWFVIAKMGNLLTEMSNLVSKIEPLLETARAPANSGVVGA